tara:strand:- start:43611 stop:45515 length:1905 start_codon:yes stop_codon:yes gene_type:complete
VQKNPIEILKQYWGHSSFRGSQEKVINALLQQNDVLALMPTGGGKSICYQVPALSMDGICVVVSPLVSLIQDQVQRLKRLGIKAIALTGSLKPEELIEQFDNCLYGGYKFLYLSPERLLQQLVRDRIKEMNVCLIAIDEAHCISQWGHDFRPAYLQCHELKRLAPQAPVIALTATPTATVAKDIVELLELDNPITFKDSLARENITFFVRDVEDKRYHLLQLVGENDQSGIVYVNTRRATIELSTFLKSKGCRTDYFHGGLLHHEKKKKLEDWLNNETKIMVATSAFGMGVDKADVRFVVHHHIPDSLESYFQEVGRAGRDDLPAKAVLLTNAHDRLQAKKQFLGSQPDVLFIKLLYKKLNAYFQIAYGEGDGQTFTFLFNEFCQQYQLNTLLAYNGLRILDQHSVIAWSNASRQTSTVQFLAKKHELFKYLDKNPSLDGTIKSILRTYGGIFDYETPINTSLIAKKNSLTEDKVDSLLQKLHNDGILAYNASKSDMELTFLVPREDDKVINVFAHKLKDLNKNRQRRFADMLAYIDNTEKCRAQFLLEYFGQTATNPCGQCDICQKDQGQPTQSLAKAKKEVLRHLKQRSLSSKELTNHLNYSEKIILESIQELLDEEEIMINTRNQYDITKQ